MKILDKQGGLIMKYFKNKKNIISNIITLLLIFNFVLIFQDEYPIFEFIIGLLLVVIGIYGLNLMKK